MANRCRIEISIPFEDIPDDTERQQYRDLYKAQCLWRQKYPNEAPFGEEYEKFLLSQPNVASDIFASFGDKNGELWFQSDRLRYYIAKHQFTEVPMVWWFKYGFPWWAQIGFANGEKAFGSYSNEPEGHGWLIWELQVTKVLENLKYAIRIHEEFPVNGLVWEWYESFVYLDELKQIYAWFQKINLISPAAMATLDWSEVASYQMDHKSIKSHDEPNEIMASIKHMAKHIAKLNSGELSSKEFRKIYAYKAEEYTSIVERDPFESERMSIWPR